MMEKHKCKLCFRNFSNGRALGGHMRSHMMNLTVRPKQNESPPPPPPPIQLSFEAESASSPSSSSFEEDKGLIYGLRENPKKSFRFSDPEFADTGSVILQDRESETESSKNPTRKRSKRTWQLSALDQQQQQTVKKIKLCIPSCKNESLSSASDTTTEEDVAFCLMMLSRDKWKTQKKEQEEQQLQELLEAKYEEEEEEDDDDDDDDEEEQEEEDDEEESDEYEELNKSLKTTTTTTTTTTKTRVRGRYKCETCNKVFRSYQALGGHRASHKKIKVTTMDHEPELEHENVASASVPIMVEKKIHECPVCFRVFASGQALGGHKRTHVIGSAPTPTPTSATPTATASASATTHVRSSAKLGGESLIDLNLPAPVDDEDDFGQIVDSAVSDAEFVKPH